MALGRSSNHCCKSIEGHTCCSKINSWIDHVRHLLSKREFYADDCNRLQAAGHTSPTSRNVSLNEGWLSGPFLLAGASLGFTDHPILDLV